MNFVEVPFQLRVADHVDHLAVLEDHLSGRRNHGFEIWGLAVLVAWHRMRVARPPDPPEGVAARMEMALVNLTVRHVRRRAWG